jgi:outer membrane receptor for ferrienterochelin and colicins
MVLTKIFCRKFAKSVCFFCSCASLMTVQSANAQSTTGLDSTVVYPASYFSEFAPVSASDMIDRVPGIALALDAGNTGSNSQNNNSRGLGAGAQILIGGKRLAAKDNEARAQLSRIAASQVDYIEIIRGTSGELDVRSAGQIVNIVLLESLASATTTIELGASLHQDGELVPQGSFVYGASQGALNYLVSLEQRSFYESLESRETSVKGDFSPNDIILFDQYRDQRNLTLNSNISYEFSPADRVALNALVADTSPPTSLERSLTRLAVMPPMTVYERETLPSERENWELGGDYEHGFANGSRFRVLFIANEETHSTVRERFTGTSPLSTDDKNLYLATDTLSSERIVRAAYNFQLADTQGVEFGVERAITRLESALRMGTKQSGFVPADLGGGFGGLVPVAVPNANSTIEEVRYEPYAVHNWQLNSRMSLETTLLVELSSIEQSGDVANKREFTYPRPKIDYRFDINPAMQLRLSLERYISQLSFSDFTAVSSNRDQDQAIEAGNPELVQQKEWRYGANIEYRLADNAGVLNANFFHYDIEEVIGKIDVTPALGSPLSANGNVADGKIYGVNFDISIRYAFWNLPPALLTAGLLLQQSRLTDPMNGDTRNIPPYDRGNFRFGLRQDLPAQGLSLGVNYRDGIEGNRTLYDIDKIDRVAQVPALNVFVEKSAFNGTVFRFEANNLSDARRCRIRTRFSPTIASNVISEIEDICTANGVQYVFMVRKTL